MPYIGKEPTTGNFVYADDITTSSTNTYNILVGGVAFSPESANHLIVSLNGVIQKANTSFSVSGSQITFLPSSGTLSSSDSIDFILILGRVNDIGVASSVSDSSITKGKLNLISDSSSAGLTVKGDGSSENGTIQLNCSQNSHGVKISSPAHSAGQSYELILPTGNVTADKVLKVASVSGSGSTGIGQLSFGDAGGITEADAFRISADQNGDSSPITGNIERVDDATFAKIGTGMSQSSGIFTFPSTGLYYIGFTFQIQLDANSDGSMIGQIMGTANNSSYDALSECALSGDTSNNQNQTASIFAYFNCTDTSTHKVRFDVSSMNSNNMKGATNETKTGFTFIRLGNSV